MNETGKLFKVSIFGESHGSSVGVLIDGVKPGLSLTKEELCEALERRKNNYQKDNVRLEDDEVFIESGIFNGYTTGKPILMKVYNKNIDNSHYDKFSFRPSHSDFTYYSKYHGYNDYLGGGASSGRITIGVVLAGVIAKKMVKSQVEAKVISLYGATNDFDKVLESDRLDSFGGIVEIKANNVPIGLGEPFFDSVESRLASLYYSVGGVKGVEFGIGFDGEKLKGSEFNDLIIDKCGKTKTNHDGGINGGITNGNEIIARVFVKPTPSISKPQETFNFKENKMDTLVIGGRHDQAFILRTPIIFESLTYIALADFVLLNEIYK